MESHAGMHILVIEDDAQYRRLVARMLEAVDFKVTAVEDFSAAAPLIEGQGTIDLLLTDIGMPAGTPHGLSIGKMAQLRRPSLKVVYMSGSDAGDFALSVGESILRKPFTAAKLIDVVKAALGP